jgi:hypothetical protein
MDPYRPPACRAGHLAERTGVVNRARQNLAGLSAGSFENFGLPRDSPVESRRRADLLIA